MSIFECLIGLGLIYLMAIGLSHAAGRDTKARGGP